MAKFLGWSKFQRIYGMLFKTCTHAHVSVTDEMNEDESISTTSSVKRPAEVSSFGHVSALRVLCTVYTS